MAGRYPGSSPGFCPAHLSEGVDMHSLKQKTLGQRLDLGMGNGHVKYQESNFRHSEHYV